MPIYEYECEWCCHRFERKQGFHEAPEAECPQCREQARRVFTPTAIVFKGSGFYITDSRKNKGETAGEEKPKGEKKKAAASEKEK
ncbi:FmdB family zinc ribbon protein [Chloroflexota bacterium]